MVYHNWCQLIAAAQSSLENVPQNDRRDYEEQSVGTLSARRVKSFSCLL